MKKRQERESQKPEKKAGQKQSIEGHLGQKGRWIAAAKLRTDFQSKQPERNVDGAICEAEAKRPPRGRQSDMKTLLASLWPCTEVMPTNKEGTKLAKEEQVKEVKLETTAAGCCQQESLSMGSSMIRKSMT